MSDPNAAFQTLRSSINDGNTSSITDNTYKGLFQYYANIESYAAESVADDLSKTSQEIEGFFKTKKFSLKLFSTRAADTTISRIKYLIYALENEYIDPNKFLVWIIASIDDKEKNIMSYDGRNNSLFQNYLMLIALCLRYGANPNMYVVEPDYGKIHLIVYTLIRFKAKNIVPRYPIERDFVKQVILIMTLLGSNVTMRAIYNDDVEITASEKYNRKIIEEATKRASENAGNATVDDFIKGVGYERESKFSNSLIRKDMFAVIDEPYSEPRIIMDRLMTEPDLTFPIKIGLLIDDPKYAIPVSGIKEFMPNFDIVLKYNDIRVLQNMKIDDNDPNALNSHSESLRVLETIECAALEAFIELLQRGFKMSYFTMNRLIIKMLYYFDRKDKKFDRVYSEVYVSMLKSAIALGVPIDKYQLDYIAKTDPKTSDGLSVVTQIKETYAIPLWKKACATSQKAKLPKSVELYAASLGIGNDPSKLEFNMTTQEFDFLQPTKREICTGLSAMMIKPSEEVKKEAMERLRRKIEVTAPKVSDLVLGKYTVPVCDNTGYFGNPLEYNDATLAYYRDAKESLYCFPSTMYKELVETRRNPYTNDELPTDLLIKMDKTLEIFKRLSIDTDKTVPVSVAFKNLNSVEDINYERTNYAIETVSMLFYSRGLRKEWIQNQDAKTYNLILELPDIDMKQSYLEALNSSPTFRYATFCKALYSGIKKQPLNQIPVIMNKIILALKNSGTKTT
jgi:hypothetical protein